MSKRRVFSAKEVYIGRQFKDEEFEESFHTKISYWLSIIAIGVLLLVGTIRIIEGSDPQWSYFALGQAGFGLMAFLILQGLYKQPVFPRRDGIKTAFKPINVNEILFRTVPMLILVGVSLYLVPSIITVTNVEQAMYMVFSAVTEELFFRGLLMFIFIRWTKRFSNPVIYIGIALQAFIFAILHFNYWGDFGVLFGVFLSGVVFGLAYALWRDITTNMLVHFIWNFIQAIGLGLFANWW